MNKTIYKEIVEKKPFLFWSVDDKRNLSDAVIVETVLNYGDWHDVKLLFSAFGMRKVSEIFFTQTAKKRHNYRKPTENFFRLYFEEHIR